MARRSTDRLCLDRDARDWPNRTASRYVVARRMRWHVQRMGSGPVLLLLHGAGAATHSWRALMPLLARHFDVVAPDLPGHGFTDRAESGRQSLAGMSLDLQRLLREIDASPQIVVGHSAGAAILARMCMDGAVTPRLLVSLNGALLPFEGLAGHLFPPMAKLLFLNPLTPRFFAWTADRGAVTRLLHGTGSVIDAAGIDFYARLLANPAHVAGALAMMAHWDLDGLQRDLGGLRTPTTLLVGTQDRAVPPRSAEILASRIPAATLVRLRGLGHLAHEEKPDLVADLIIRLAREAGLLPKDPPS